MKQVTAKPKKKRNRPYKYAPPILTRLSPEQLPKVDAIAEEEHCSRAKVIRDAVADKIASYDFEPEEQ